ncbi:hypothetical protein [Marinitoga sp. 38H-ov]|uniref:hypothetical protein n=1 Tax=Marinitoga sp. 38H-ov TaxID=1755814 RepID=UPI0013EA4F2B|nr:hypothetical protein [Marinitoga sp. 38H-ov]KAF2955616.1 hypothetical protein AS160_00435 [Marinitoga sp. 38H-ov]
MREYWYLIPLISVILIISVLNYNIKENVIIPNKIEDLNGISKIEINGINIKIKFDPNSDKLFFSNKINMKTINDKLILYNNENKKENEIIIGSKNYFNNIIIKGTNIEIEGDIKSKNFYISGVNIIMKKNVHFQGDYLIFDGTNLLIRGMYDLFEFSSSGITTTIDFNIKRCENIQLESISINGDIIYEDVWDGIRNISIDGISKNIIIKVKKENSGIIKSNNTIKIIKY